MSGDADTITREADSPNSAAAWFRRGSRAIDNRVERNIGATIVSAKAALGERHCHAAVRAVVSGHNETIVRERHDEFLKRAFKLRGRVAAEVR